MRLCVQLSEKIRWDQDRPVEGFAYGEIFHPECRLAYLGQNLSLSGNSILKPDLRFSMFTLDKPLPAEKSGYLDPLLSKIYGTELFFTSAMFDDEGRTHFFESGQVHKGVLCADNHPHIETELLSFEIGQLKYTKYDNWMNSDVEYWPNGTFKSIQRVHGTAVQQNKIYVVESDDVQIHENGALQCASFMPSTVFKTRTNKPYRLTDQTRRVCFEYRG